MSLADAATANAEEIPKAYWEAVLPGIPMPPAIINLLLAQQKVRTSLDGVTINPNNLKFLKGARKIGSNYEKHKSEPDHEDKHVHISSQVEDSLKEISMSYGSQGKEDIEKSTSVHKSRVHGDLKGPSMLHGSQIEEEVGKVFATQRANMEENLKEISVSYGLEGKKDSNKVLSNLNKIFAAYRPWKQENLKEISVSYGSKGGKGKTEVSRAYRLEGEKELKEISLSYGVEGDDVLKEISVSYGAEGRKSLKEGSVSSEAKQDRKLREISVSYGLDEGKDEDNKFLDKDEEDPHKATMSYGSEHEDDPYKATMSYGSEHEDDPHKVTMSYVPRHEKDLKTFSTRHTTLKVKGEGSHHAHSHNHGNKKRADVFFFHDMLRPGSVITPTIPPTTSLPALLPRGVAESIPFSMERISDIMAILAPASLAMAREIRWTLDTCDHPRTLSGQKAGCATSLESLAELPASLLGRRNIRAFSAMDLPMDAPGTPALRGKYNVTAARKLSGSSSEVVTCHDLTYPYAVYYCHTSSPTAAYMVTLTSVEEDTSPATMEVMAVCHLDTSLWSPKNPFFELHKVGPGDVAVCHFLTKLSIIWVSVDGHVDAL